MTKLHRSGATLALNQVVCEGCGFLRNLVLARLLGADQMGWAIMLALLAVSQGSGEQFIYFQF